MWSISWGIRKLISKTRMICANCQIPIDYDESGLCLHCFCDSENLACQCSECKNNEYEDFRTDLD